jgi:hypothetical protein
MYIYSIASPRGEHEAKKQCSSGGRPGRNRARAVCYRMSYGPHELWVAIYLKYMGPAIPVFRSFEAGHVGACHYPGIDRF